uniref:Ribosomal protein S11 n=1 Tax=Analipus japonicus TaxID=31333 RepID=A0A8F0FD25_9PHAE|nr:ribosomal protein S11 [Analipus japonicus]
MLTNKTNLFNKSPKLKELRTQTVERKEIMASLVKGGHLGSVYIKCTKRNIFCALINTLENKVITSCSMRVPPYENEFNERENLQTRGFSLGRFFGEKLFALGHTKLILYLNGKSKGRSGVIEGLDDLGIDIHSVVLITSHPHNGCRPPKTRRKKFRTKAKFLK